MVVYTYIFSLFTYQNLVRAIAGGAGNAFAITVCYPLECARTRLQVDDRMKAKYSLEIIKDIFLEEGFFGVYRGIWSLVVSFFCSSFVYFFMFQGLKSALTLSEQSIIMDLIFGSLAGTAVVFVTSPLWVANTRLKLQGAKLKTDSYKNLKHPAYSGIVDCMQKIAAYEGMLELWSGTFTSLLLITNPAIQFMIYEALKRLTQSAFQSVVLSGYYYFTFGALSKMVATLCTYPLQLMQTRIRAGYTGKSILNLEGGNLSVQSILAMYRGLESKLSQTILTAALTLLTYEEISLFVFQLMRIDPAL